MLIENDPIYYSLDKADKKAEIEKKIKDEESRATREEELKALSLKVKAKRRSTRYDFT